MSTRFVLACCLCLFCRAPALAQDSAIAEAKAQASAHFRRGVELFQEEAFRAAAVEFQRAYELAPDYRLLYNVGQSKLNAQDYLGAAQSLQEYLAQGGQGIAEERRRQVEEDLAALRERVGRIRVTVNLEQAEVFIDDVRVGTTPLGLPVLANVGRHRVLVRGADGANEARVVDLAGGDVVHVSFALGTHASSLRSEPRAQAVPSPTLRRTAIATWSTAGALAIAGAVTAGLAARADDELQDLLGTANVSARSVSDKRGELKGLALSTDVLLGTAAASALAGTLLWLLDRRERQPETRSARAARASLQLDLSPYAAGLRAQF